MEFIGTCADKRISLIAEKCNRRLHKKKMNRMVKEQYPELYYALALNLYNPYSYYQNDEYYNLVHSQIDYIFKK